MLGKWYTSWKAARSKALRSSMPDGTWYKGEIYPTGKKYTRARYDHAVDHVLNNNRYPSIPDKPSPDWTGTLFEESQ